ncbi:zinc finger BED domain-containing protein RICESLEEPER 2 [Tanacetum coccineum]
MARDLLTVQASTVASESAFSISGRIISERRSRLTPESVEVLCILKDYLDGVDRVQHETSLECPILEDVEETIAREEVELGISPPNTELDEGEFEDLDIDHALKFFGRFMIEYNVAGKPKLDILDTLICFRVMAMPKLEMY